MSTTDQGSAPARMSETPTGAIAKVGPTRPRRRFSARSLLAPLVALVIFLILWEVLVRTGVILDLILPPPSRVAGALGQSVLEIFTGGPMQMHLFTTLAEILLGFFFSVIIGVIVALIMSEFRVTRDALFPFVVAMNATPTIALAPLFVIWFGVGVSSKVILILTGATFPIIVSTMAGLAATDDETLRLFRAMGATRWETFRRVRIHNALPYLFAGLELAIVSASIGAVVGEFTGGNAGLGYVTLLAQDTYNLEQAFATLIILALVGITLHRLVVLIREKIVFWAPGKTT